MGVKQGAATSGILFIIYIDRKLRMIKSKIDDDGFLKDLHTLLLMDDTVLFATSREKLIEKFNVVCDFCNSYGVKLNEKKTNMVVNNKNGDKIPISFNDITVKYSSFYVYLGATITDDGSYTTPLKCHIECKMKQVLKYFSFLDRIRISHFPSKSRSPMHVC